jgi:NTE family protein
LADSNHAAQKPVNLALQGGGAHGAFAWGVLDKLLEDGRLAIQAMSATSAGSMNAVVMAYGFSLRGADGAREKLAEFWREIAETGMRYSPVQAMPWDTWLEGFGLKPDISPTYLYFEALTHTFSPYQLNPLNINPLRDVLEKVVDFDHLKQCKVTARLFVSATNVRSGKIKVFENHELSSDAVLASACLPYIFQAVEIDGEAYWDGGFMGNPAIYPLIYHGASRDVVIVHINPIVRNELPRTAPEIFDRINEISFNSSLMREMRAIAFVARLVTEGNVDAKRYNRMLIHSIRDDAELAKLGIASKMMPSWDMISHLKQVGRVAAGDWLDKHFDKVGHDSSIDLAATFL